MISHRTPGVEARVGGHSDIPRQGPAPQHTLKGACWGARDSQPGPRARLSPWQGARSQEAREARGPSGSIFT